MRTVKEKLSKQQQEELFVKLARSLAMVNSAEESAKFLQDLLSEPEVFMLARRLEIAEMLIVGATYEEIREEMHVGWSTIAKVQTWLSLYGEGYRTVVERISKAKKEKAKVEKPRAFNQLKHKYPMYFWPQLLLEEIVKTANEREKRRLKNVVEKLREKNQLSRELSRLLKTE